ncbi:MAG: acyloxyacyl hydrolase, partial [Raineya sp.]|nr:acyloxyacyl hydrolase [Raineya sp.]
YFNRYHLGKLAWEQDFRYPQTSFALTYFNYQNPIIGHSLAVSANMLLPIYRHTKHNLQFKIGTGIAFATNPFDIENNFQNNVLSNVWSYVMQGGFWWNYHLNSHWKLKTGLQITHYSNGAFKLPNAGVNVITAFVGTSYVFNPEKIIYSQIEKEPFQPKWYLQNTFSGSLIETEINQPRKHSVFNLGLYVARDVSRKHRLNAGLDISWNEGIKYQIDQKFANATSKPDYRRISVVIGDEITFGDMSLNIQLGYYIRRQFEAKTDMPFYQRYGLKWYFHKNIFAGLLLKTHASVAECAEFTLGTHWQLHKYANQK